MYRHCLTPGLSVLGLAYLVATSAQAQNIIEPDTTLGPEPSVVIPLNEAIDLIHGGAQRGGNLFHSFETFSIGNGGAYFITPPGDVATIFARITGANLSTISGILGTRQFTGADFLPSTADLILINPNGIIFGETAVLDVGGSFTATTASGVQFGNAGRFSAVAPEAPSSLLSIAPSAYFFNALQPGDIVNRSVRPDLIDGTAIGLRVPDGGRLTLLGGDIAIEGGWVIANGGYIELAAAGSGVVSLAADSSLSFAEGVEWQDITISDGALVASISADGGAITLMAEDISMFDASLVAIGISGAPDNGTGQAGDLTVQSTGNVRLDNLSLMTNRVLPGRAGKAGNLQLSARNLEVTNGAALNTSTFGAGNAGDVVVTIAETARFDGIKPDGSGASFAGSQVEPGAVGQSGNLQLSARNLEVTNGAQLSASTFGRGNAGDVVVTITETARFDGVHPIDGSSASFAGSTVAPGAVGQGGNLQLSARNLEVTNGAALNTSTLGAGNAGAVEITIAEMARLDGVNPFGGISSSAVQSQVESGAVGQGGTLQLTARNLEVTNGAQISAGTSSVGNGGDVVLTITETARFDGVNPFGGSNVSSVVSQVNAGAVGQGGNLQLTARNLEVTNGAQISASTFGTGDGGDVAITITETARFDGVNPFGGSNVSSVVSQVNAGAVGQGGNLQLTARNLEVTNGAALSASTFSAGDGGDVVLTIAETARFDGDNPFNANSSSGAGSQVQQEAVGQGGNLQLTARNLEVTNGARLSAASGGVGDAGNIELNIQDRLTAHDGTITTLSLFNAGGQIDITASNILLSGNSDIQTFVDSGTDEGGNITMTADFIIALNDSDILAFAEDGVGGNITLQTPAFFGQNFTLASLTADPDTLDGNDRVDINATGAVAGLVTLPNVSLVENSLNDLTEAIVVIDQLLAGSCIARADDNQGSFVVTGGGGLPARPGDSVLSAYPTSEVRSRPDTSEAIWQPGDPIIEPTGVFELTDGRLVLSRECS
jgi:filamentous hemagglutinin family protein